LSGGGPIIYPSVDAFTLLPILPQSLSSSPIVVPGNSKIEIIIGDNRNKAILSIDSHDKVELRKGDKVLVKKSSESIALIHPKDHDFYSSCRNKLGWSKSL
jgi:NAD+ kinase